MSLDMLTNDPDVTSMEMGGASYLGKGDKGDKGDPGEDGFSPVVSSTAIQGGHTLNVTDKTHTESFDVMDGEDGEDGVYSFEFTVDGSTAILPSGVTVATIITAAQEGKKVFCQRNGSVYELDHYQSSSPKFAEFHKASMYVEDGWTIRGRATVNFIEDAETGNGTWFSIEDEFKNNGRLVKVYYGGGLAEATPGTDYLTEHQSLASYSTTAQMNEAIAAHHDSTKQDTISDLSTIRSGAAAGATAVQPSAISDMATKTWTSGQGYLTQHQDISGKVDKVDGKGLSSNDYTTAEKNKLAGIAAGAEVNVQSDWSQSDNTADDFIKNKPTIPDDADEITYDSSAQSHTAGSAGAAIAQISQDLQGKVNYPNHPSDNKFYAMKNDTWTEFSGGSGEDEIEYFTYNVSTYEEIAAAYTSGKTLKLKMPTPGGITLIFDLVLSQAAGESYLFSFAANDNQTNYTIDLSPIGWGELAYSVIPDDADDITYNSSATSHTSGSVGAAIAQISQDLQGKPNYPNHPSDNKFYAMKNDAWTEFSGGGGGSVDYFTVVNGELCIVYEEA